MTHVLDWDALQVEDEKLYLDLIHILQHWRLTLRGWDIEKVRLQWDPNDENSATWEDVVRLRDLFPYLFVGFQE